MLIDSHAHINDDRLINEADDIVNNMAINNLEAVINIGCDRLSSEISFAMSQKYPNVYATVGIHPEEAGKRVSDDYDYFRKCAVNPKVVGIGEIGLDYYYEFTTREMQQKVFIEQLELARDLNLPVVIHLRDAYQDMLNICKQNAKLIEQGALLHCYSGSKEMAKEFAKLGMYFSFGGAITFKNAVDKPEIIRSVPFDRLLVETDCPYMTPTPFRGKTNYPKYVNLVAKRMAQILEKPLSEIIETTNKNTKEFFKKIK